MSSLSIYRSPVGTLAMECSESGLHGLWLSGQRYIPSVVQSAIDDADATGTPGTTSTLDVTNASSANINPSGPGASRTTDVSRTAAPHGDGVEAQCARWLDAYFAGDKPDPRELPLAAEGTDFQRDVWEALLAVPYSSTLTYRDLAAIVAGPERAGRMARAVGTAVGKNPLLIVVPCHRVVPATGGTGEYAGGAGVKRWLLEHEASSATHA